MRKRFTSSRTLFRLAILSLYFAVAIGMTWPLARRLTTHLPGGSQDTLVHYWNGWWVKQALQAGQSPYQTDYLYHSQGLSLVYHNFAWFSIVTWLALAPLTGGFAAYNLSVLINLALCGLGAFLLAYELTGDRRAAFLAGLIYQCWPFRLYQLDHPNLISTQWIPLFLLFLIRTMERKRWQDGMWAGLFLALTGYTRWQQLIPAAILGGIYFLSTLPRQHPHWRRWVPLLALTGLITIAALTPPFLMLMRQQRTAPAEVLREDEEERMQTDLLAYVTPSDSHPVLKSITQPAYKRYYPNRFDERRFAAYIGLIAFGLASYGAWKARRRALPWAAMGITLILLALGPVLSINGQTYPNVPMPYNLAARLYVVRLLRVPDRFNMFLALPVAMLAAYGFTDILRRTQIRTQGRRRSLILVCLLSGVVLFEYTPAPVSLRHPHQSEFYHQLADESDEFAVLNLPISAVASKRYMFAQITHRHPIVQGKTPRFPEGAFNYLNSHPWLQALDEYGTMPPAHDDAGRQLASLAQDDVRYILLHKDITSPLLRMPHWRHYFLFSPRFEDDNIVVYATAPQAGRDFTLLHELAPGIGPVRIITPTHCLRPGQPLWVEVGWGTQSSPGQDLSVRLALEAGDGTVGAQEIQPLSANWPTREWPANAVAWGDYVVQVPPSSPDGHYTTTLALTDQAAQVLGPSVPVGQVVVTNDACIFPIPEDAVNLNVLFGRELRLLGYQLARDEAQLTLTLHWRAERLMDVDYKIYVHVFDPDTGFRPIQDDAMPLRWNFPTTYWRQGDIVSDPIPLPLTVAPPGVYRIAVGAYDPDTGKRLPVIDRAGELQPDDQLVLPGEMIDVE